MQVTADVQRAVRAPTQGGSATATGVMVLHDARAKTLRAAVQRVLDGESLRAICRGLR
ncbi:hypothetical protein [Microbacterium sp. CGR1]|uniref:hypothetical protein n=1 Tax=Microbacterium sp. CGR1 TaxID=1696072 RepID=UPI003DA374E5